MKMLETKKILQAQYLGSKDLRERGYNLYLYTRSILDELYPPEVFKENAKKYSSIALR